MPDQRYVVMARSPFTRYGHNLELVKSYPCNSGRAIATLAYLYSRFPNTEFYLQEVD